MLHPKKVGTIALKGRDEEKQTNEIKIAAPMLDAIEIKGRTITADALLTQRELAKYLAEERHANYHFTVKQNQQNLLEDIAYYFQHTPATADFTHTGNGEHGRIETRKIWVTEKLNHYLDFPYVGQEVSFGNNVATRVRRLISLLTRSSRLLVRRRLRWWSGKSNTLNPSGIAFSAQLASFGAVAL